MGVIFKQRHRHHIITFTVVYFNFCFRKKIFFHHTTIQSWFFFFWNSSAKSTFKMLAQNDSPAFIVLVNTVETPASLRHQRLWDTNAGDQIYPKRFSGMDRFNTAVTNRQSIARYKTPSQCCPISCPGSLKFDTTWSFSFFLIHVALLPSDTGPCRWF